MKRIDRRSWLVGGMLAAAAGKTGAADASSVPITALAATPDGKRVLAGSQAGIDVYSVPSLERVAHHEIAADQIARLRFDARGRLWIAGGIPAETGIVELRRWPDATLLARYEDHEDVVWDVDVVGGWLAAASLDRSISVRHVLAGAGDGGAVDGKTERISGHSRAATGVAWLEAGRSCVTVGLDQIVRVWKRTEDKWGVVRALNQHRGGILAVARRPDHRGTPLPQVMTCGNDRTIRLWQPTIGRLMRFVRLERAVPVDGAWTDDGRWFAAACDDGAVRWIDPQQAKVARVHRASRHALSSIVALPGDPSRAIVGDFHGSLHVVPRP